MRTLSFLLVVIIGFLFVDNVNAQEKNQEKSGIEVSAKDSIEYDLIVFDSGFETYLATVPYSKEFYSNEYYKHWNILYCAEWNRRNQDPLRFGGFYETSIDYDPSIDYGIDFNFKLYQYFQFVEDEHDIILIKRKGN